MEKHILNVGAPLEELSSLAGQLRAGLKNL